METMLTVFYVPKERRGGLCHWLATRHHVVLPAWGRQREDEGQGLCPFLNEVFPTVSFHYAAQDEASLGVAAAAAATAASGRSLLTRQEHETHVQRGQQSPVTKIMQPTSVTRTGATGRGQSGWIASLNVWWRGGGDLSMNTMLLCYRGERESGC